MKLFKIPYCKSTNFVYRLRRIIFKFDRSIIYIIYIYIYKIYVCIAIMWKIQCDRNNYILNDSELNGNLLKSILFYTLYDWLHAFGNLHCDSFLDFIAIIIFLL